MRDPKKSFPKMEKWWPLPTDEQPEEFSKEKADKYREMYKILREQNGGRTTIQDRG